MINQKLNIPKLYKLNIKPLLEICQLQIGPKLCSAVIMRNVIPGSYIMIFPPILITLRSFSAVVGYPLIDQPKNLNGITKCFEQLVAMPTGASPRLFNSSHKNAVMYIVGTARSRKQREDRI